ncbi:PBECR4 domain-containing protein [Sporanaerobacter acetigenes]|uniref:PBECR4 domain-containing protein n=1 Tax=Sporanaerobacter acetigenes TaxID=165813 RepID=UPI00332E3D6F
MEVIKDKKEYLRIIVQAAALYKENLLNKNMLIIYEKQKKQYFYLDILFLKSKRQIHPTF